MQLSSVSLWTGLIGLPAPIASQIQLVLNWFEELARVVPVHRQFRLSPVTG